MISKILCLYVVVAVLNISQAVSLTEIHPLKSIQYNMKSLSNLDKISTQVSEDWDGSKPVDTHPVFCSYF